MARQLPRKGNTTNHPVKYDRAYRKGFLAIYEEEKTITAAAERYGVPRDAVTDWIARDKWFRAEYYKIHTRLSDQYRGVVLEKYLECGSIKLACELCGIALSAFYNWVKEPEYQLAYIATKALIKDTLYAHAVKRALEDDRMLRWLIERMEIGENQARVTHGNVYESSPEDVSYTESLQDIKSRAMRLADEGEDGAREGTRKDGSILPFKVHTPS